MTAARPARPGGDLFGARPLGAFLAAAVALAIAAPGAAAAADAKQSIVAQARVPVVSLYRTPGAKRPFLKLSNPNRNGAPLVFLVKERRPGGWEKVYLPVRPNGSTAWIRARQVELAVNPYRVRVSLGAHTITVWNGVRVIHRERAGVGRSIVPTPAGTYYLAELLAQPNPGGAYGPYAFGLSAHSDVLYSFGGGPGQIGLHGTNNPASLGTNASHGCIRISNAGITKLARILPLGTPVRIGY
jgi:lipoprotein-anchoring transpeptidase ErfK/SrfK